MTGFFACKDDDAGPTLKVNAPPAITTPTAGASLELNEADKDAPFSFTWTALSLSLTDLPKATYKLQMDLAGNNFSAPATLSTSGDLSYEMTVGALNNKLISLGMIPDAIGGIELRLAANVDNKLDNIYSAVVSLNVKPYSDVVIVKPIYLLGSGTPAGWDNTIALPMTYLDGGRFEIVTTLTTGSDQYFKFISKLGNWAPQWGGDANGALLYRPTEADPDPAGILTPATTSQYKIIADTALLTYSVEEYGDIYLLGDATAAGWDNMAALPLAKVAEGKYTIITNLGAGYWKLIDERGLWAPQWGGDANGNLLFRPTESDPDPSSVQAPATAGSYKIDVDIVALKYTVTLQ